MVLRKIERVLPLPNSIHVDRVSERIELLLRVDPLAPLAPVQVIAAPCHNHVRVVRFRPDAVYDVLPALRAVLVARAGVLKIARLF